MNGPVPMALGVWALLSGAAAAGAERERGGGKDDENATLLHMIPAQHGGISVDAPRSP